MKELKLSQVVKLEKKALKQVHGGNIKPPCGCGCAEFNGLNNSDSSHGDNHK